MKKMVTLCALIAPAGSFVANAIGLHEMHGNVWEWVENCWSENYSGAPANGDAWISGASPAILMPRRLT